MCTDNIYYRFLNDSYAMIKNFEKENCFVIDRISKINSGKLIVSSDEKKLLRDRYRTNSRELNELYSSIYSLKIVCIEKSKDDPCRETKKQSFDCNSDYINFLLRKMVDKGYLYNENIVEDIRNIYMLYASIEDKNFEISVGNKIKLSRLNKKSRI